MTSAGLCEGGTGGCRTECTENYAGLLASTSFSVNEALRRYSRHRNTCAGMGGPHVHACACICACVCVYMCVRVRVYVYVCVYEYVYNDNSRH